MKKIISICLAATLLSSFVSSDIETKSETTSYRTVYTIYGDVNGDKIIDSFDVAAMRNKIVTEVDYNVICDLNHDNLVDVSDLQLLQDYILGETAIFDAYYYDDADTDGICDLFEITLLKTNPDSKDTDGDTLSDLTEIIYSRTSPNEKYTRGLSVTDADDDPDEDNLTNKEEINYGSNPQLADSDFDDISDYDELKKYNTNLNTDDSDDDNITDYDEIKLDLSPISKQSDGITLDNQRTFNHTFSHSSDFLSDINNDDNPYLLSIEIASAGNVENALSIQIGGFSDVINNISIVGEPVTLSYKEDLKVDTVKIEFKPKEIDESIENYMIFKYFPRTNYLLPVETKYTQDSTYIETDEVGTYCLVNTKYRVQDDFTVNNTPHNNDGYGAYEVVCDYELGETEVIFFVDVSGALLEEKNFEETKNSIHNFSQAVFDHSANSTVQIYGYYSNPYNYDTGLVPYTDSNNYPILCSMNSVDEATDKISNCIDSKNNNLDYGILLLNDLCNDDLFTTECNNRYAFIISDSTYTFTDRIGYKSSIPRPTKDSLQSIFDNNVHLNFLLSPDNYKCKSALENLEDICEPYAFNIIEKSKTPGFTDDKYASIYSDAVIKLDTFTYFFSYSINPDTIPEKVERNAFINSLPPKYSYKESLVPEADSDGNIDFKEATVAVGAAKYDEFGNLIFETLYDACNISDITAKGYEQFMEKKNISDSVIASNIQITPFSDKILYTDNDKDGLVNKLDESPDTAIDSNFKVINSSKNYGIDNLISEEYQKVIKKGKDNYESIQEEWYEGTIDELLNYCMSVGGVTVFSSFFLHCEEILDSGIQLGATPHGADALCHYLQGSGEDFLINLAIPLGLHKTQRIRYYNQLNSFFDMTEQTIKPGHIYSFATTTTPDKKWSVNYGNRYAISEQVADDWWLTFGGANNALIADVSCDRKEDGKMHYIANIKYYIYDYYDWDGKDEEKLANLHKYGKAQNFRTIGCYPVTVEWIEGKRYPISVNSDYPLSTTEFDGINDGSALKKAYDYGKKYYDRLNYGGVIEW